MASVDDTMVNLTLTVTTTAGMALKLKDKIGGLPLLMTRVSYVEGPGDKKKAHRERLERAVAMGIPTAPAAMEAYDGRGPEDVELTIRAGTGTTGEQLDNLNITIKPAEEVG